MRSKEENQQDKFAALLTIMPLFHYQFGFAISPVTCSPKLGRGSGGGAPDKNVSQRREQAKWAYNGCRF
jgi:hypothetical protein